jgi:hypothetical protein
MAQVNNVKLFELFNGHPLVNNLGGGGSPSVEAIWDSILSSGKIIYGVASDDVHSVKKLGDRRVPTPGHGWVMVRSAELNEKAIIEALERGEFYSSTGVELEDYQSNGRSVTVAIKPERGSKYRIQFIGAGGKVLAESFENSAVYRFKGDERYVRVRVLESNGKTAWTQPVIVKK